MYHQPHPNQQQQHQPPLLLGDDTPQRQLETAVKAECSGQDKSKAATALMFDAFTSFAAANFASCPPSTSSSFFIPPNPTPIVAPLPCSSSSTAIGPPPIGGGTAKRERTKYTEGQLRYLESVFRNTMYPEGPLREQIAKCLQLSEVKVQVWFKNRRAKNRNERKFEKMRGEAVCDGGKGQAVKKEESVEDTEEENQQQEPQHPAAKKHALDRAKKRRSNSNKSASPPATQTAPAVELSQSSSLFLPYDLKGFSQGDASPLYQPSTFYPSSFGSSSAAPAEMNSLMAAAFPTPVQSFYTGWTQSPTSYAPILSSPYQNQMFGPAAAAAYYQTNNYYFAAQQAAAQQQQEGMKREEI